MGMDIQMKIKLNYLKIIILTVLVFIIFVSNVHAEPETIQFPRIGLTLDTSDNPEDVTSAVQILVLLTVLALAPSILIMMTSFTRIIIVLSFLRNAMGTQQMPPNQVLIGLALFLSLFIMQPVLSEINDNALKPYANEEITQEAAIQEASKTIKEFMLGRHQKDLGLLYLYPGWKLPLTKRIFQIYH